jgi:GNAT superfamily N-acetyltransferase
MSRPVPNASGASGDNGGVLPDALVELALRPSGRPRAGVLIDRTPERVVVLEPAFPMPGPNSVGEIRCAPERVGPLVDEVRRLAAVHGLACLWILDPDVRPPDLADRLPAFGIVTDSEVVAMVLPAGADVDRGGTAVEVVDALRDAATFAAAEAVQAAAFGSGPADGQARRFAEGRDEPRRHFLLALVDGEPAGAAWATVHEEGVWLNGGAVAPRFQGRGVYRALVAERLALARRAGAPGAGTWARPETSLPILERLGFQAVGQVRMLRDERA